ncbi:ankyrin repeat domain-containing protein [Aspergillus mulundensis]|uniref:Uncharacterized protein n=1 Tax=Aspergillus mulundensis TaxID=1810919 RepID=A0A3D8SDC2_9EURO|nr:hypothetical protein DSM5745_04420 [Aspergillus mulundensis]RDW84094.1 hypothetical protein DSM5745_04420 [Aspergillus mulundensis]
MIQALLDHPEVDPNLASDEGGTPLAEAICPRHQTSHSFKRVAQLVKLFLNNKNVDKTAPDHNGDTPLLHASRSSVEILNMLLPFFEGNVWHRNKEWKTALDIAAVSGKPDIVARLLDPSLQVMDTDLIVSNALHKAHQYYIAPHPPPTWVECNLPEVEVAMGLLKVHLEKMRC